MPKKKQKIYNHPKEFPKDTVHIFTDGSCERVKKAGTKGKGGWGVVLLFNERRLELYGGKKETTNQEMELMAILKALQALKSRKYNIVIYSDSQYSINCVSCWHFGWKRNGWQTSDGKPVRNRELIEEIVKLICPKTAFKWVKGHNGMEHNERADRLAHAGRMQQR